MARQVLSSPSSPSPISITLPPTPVPELEDDFLFEDKWDGEYRMMDRARMPDPLDSRTQFRGATGKVMIENGIMKLSGKQPRLYTNIEVQDVEVSMDYMRVGEDGKVSN